MNKSDYATLTNSGGSITANHRVSIIKICKDKNGVVQRLQTALAIPDKQTKKWTDRIPLNALGSSSGRCGTLKLQPGEYVTNLNTNWDVKTGITGVSIFTDQGYFLTIGKITDVHHSHEFEFTKDTQLIGLHGVISTLNNDKNLERLGVVEVDIACAKGERESFGNRVDNTNMIVLIVAGVVVVLILACLACHYCQFQKNKKKINVEVQKDVVIVAEPHATGGVIPDLPGDDLERGQDYDSQRQQMMKNTGGFEHEQVDDYETSNRVREMKPLYEGLSGN